MLSHCSFIDKILTGFFVHLCIRDRHSILFSFTDNIAVFGMNSSKQIIFALGKVDNIGTELTGHRLFWYCMENGCSMRSNYHISHLIILYVCDKMVQKSSLAFLLFFKLNYSCNKPDI